MIEGVPSGGYRFDVRWHSRWIWSAPPPISIAADTTPYLDPRSTRSWVCLRRVVDLDEVPAVVPARFTADSRYILWVNGTEVSRGPVRANPRRLHYDEADLSGVLEPGTNTLAVLARHYGRATPWWMPAPATYGMGGGAFTFEALIAGSAADAASPAAWLTSDRHWRCLSPDAWTELEGGGLSGVPPEWCDARRLPAGWHRPGFDDSDWSPAAELSTTFVGWTGSHAPPNPPYGPLLPRSIGRLAGPTRPAIVVGAAVVPESADAEDPVDQVGNDLDAAVGIARLEQEALPFKVELADGFEAGVLVLDFGEQTAGVIEIEIDAAPGTQLDAKAAESVDDEGRLAALQQHSGFRYIARGTDDRFSTFDRIGLRYLGLSLRGGGSVTINRAAVREQLAPRPAGPSFSCSDPLLERIWEVGRRTVDLCSQDAYLDCPSREQRAWTGDAVVHQLVDLTTNPDWRLARANLELGASPRPDGMLPMAAGGDFEHADSTYIPDWALHWIHGLYNVSRYTGDDALVRRLLPVAERVLQWFLPFQEDDGLLTDVTGWIIIDWSAVSTAGKSATLNALWGRSLREFQKLADQLGDHGRARWAGELWVQLRKDFQRFWDADRNLYVDHILDGVQQRPVSQHTNAAAVAARLTRGVDPGRLMDTVLDRDRLVHAAWLVPGRDSRSVAGGDMYAGFDYLVTGPPEPWWDVENQIVAAQPFFRYVVHDAVAVAERPDLIPDLCRDWAALLERCPTTWSEVWYGGSHCHAWSSTPTRDLMQYTLGVTPAAPGFNRAQVAPALGDLQWARGAVPTPHGLIEVEVEPGRLALTTPVEAAVVFGDIDTRVPPGVHELSR